MIETKNMEDFVQQQIASAVDAYVSAMVSDQTWTQQIEQRIQQHVQDRITARFSNLSTVPDLVDTVKTSVQGLMASGQVPGIDRYVDQAQIMTAVDRAVESQISIIIDQLMIDPVWIQKIENLINQNYMRRVGEWLSTADIDSVIKTEIDAGVSRWQDRLKQDFSTAGIRDLAKENQLTVSEGSVTVHNLLHAQDITVADQVLVEGTLKVQDLVLLGSINTDNQSWNELSQHIAKDTLSLMTDQWQQDLVKQALDLARTQGIEFQEVLLDGAPLVQNGTLNRSICFSNLQTLGALERLQVTGNSDLGHTVYVRPRRLGVNTSDPEMALAVWDEEVSLVAGKLRQNHAYIGTLKPQQLSLGVNRKSFLEINTEGLVSVSALRIERHRISFANQVPGYSGTRGDWVFNNDPKEGQPFAWVCLGAFRWQPLKAVT